MSVNTFFNKLHQMQQIVFEDKFTCWKERENDLQEQHLLCEEQYSQQGVSVGGIQLLKLRGEVDNDQIKKREYIVSKLEFIRSYIRNHDRFYYQINQFHEYLTWKKVPVLAVLPLRNWCCLCSALD